MTQIMKKIIKDHWLGLTLVSAGLLFYNWFLAGFYPSFKKIENIEKLIKQYPESLKAFFGGTFDLSTFESFINVEFFSLMFIIIVGGYIITFATSEVSKEIERGTIESLLSLPVSRFKIILTKWLSLMLISIYLVAFTVLSLLILASAYDVSLSAKAMLFIGILSFLFMASLGSLTMALAVLFSERSPALFIPIVLLVFSYVWNSVGQLIESIKDYRWISLFYYYDTAKALTEREISAASILVFSIIILLTTAFTFYWFRKRDFAV